MWRGILTESTSTSGVTNTPATSAGCKCIVESLPSASLYGYLLTLPRSPCRFTSNSWAANSTTVPLVNTTVTLTIDSPCSGFLHRASYPYMDPPVLEAVELVTSYRRPPTASSSKRCARRSRLLTDSLPSSPPVSVPGALSRTIRHRRGRFDMLFSCSVDTEPTSLDTLSDRFSTHAGEPGQEGGPGH